MKLLTGRESCSRMSVEKAHADFLQVCVVLLKGTTRIYINHHIDTTGRTSNRCIIKAL
jgi:hypothetical protein